MIFVYLIITIVTGLDYVNILKKDMNYIAKQLTNGSLPDGRLSVSDVEQLFEELQNNTEIVHSEQIGTSYLDNPIMAYSICSNYSESTPSMLITSLHHSREVASLQMNLYLFLYILWEVEHNNDPYYTHLINHNCIITVPFVNYDGYLEIQSGLQKHVPLPETRKNVNRTITCPKTTLAGVDLNRNYGYKFAYDDSGSSNDPCDETFRGAEAFSEKETQAIKNIVETRNIKMAMNLHCFGNLWIIPYSYGDEELNPNSVPAQIYKDFKLNGEFKGHYKYGHAQQLVNYNANGEAADWMLSKGVIAISPELGEEYYGNFFSNFYPDKDQTVKLFDMEFPSLLHFINYLPFQPEFIQSYQFNEEDFSLSDLTYNSSQVLIEVIYKNYGVSKGMNEKLYIRGHSIQQIYYKIINYEDEYKREFNFSILDQLQPNQSYLEAYHIPPRSQVIYYMLFEIISTQNSEIQLYFDMFEKENNITTIKLFDLEVETKNNSAIQHLLYLLYITIAILIVLVILCKKDFKKFNNQSHQITELIEQKPETVVLKIQM